MDPAFREMFEGLRQTAEGLIAANEGIKRTAEAALSVNEEEQEDLRESVGRLQTLVLDLIERIKGMAAFTRQTGSVLVRQRV